MVEYYAHSTQRTDRSDWQSLPDHLHGVAELAAKYASAFGAERFAEIGGLLHDLGKYTREFQLRLQGQFPRMDHATWGARIVLQRYGPLLGHLMAYGIAGHHAGLANGQAGHRRTSLQDRLSQPLYELMPQWEQDLELPRASDLRLPPSFKVCKERGAFQLTVLARMLYSCLVDADFVDTDNFYRRIEGRPPRIAAEAPELEQLRERLDVTLSRFCDNSPVNRLRAHILSHVRGGAALPAGLFSLTVPTGGGKTLASLAFALDHAIVHGLRRVIYVIPFTSIVEQNAQVFRAALGDLGEAAVLEHHSAFFDDPDAAPESKEKRRLAMENWDAPVVVTTAAQFLESLFADRPSRCRKLHNIAGSVVILDEAQTMPLKQLRPCVTVLDELALNYRISIVLCTATQPALTLDDGFVGGLRDVRELAPDPPRLYQQLRRVNVRHIGAVGDDTLVGHLREHEQILCIVNNRRHARALFESIADESGAYHLTTLMCAKHRSQTLAAIKQRLTNNLPCRLVATSLIEAGVDIDLPTVLRAEAGLDSIAQAAGRCNREGLRPQHTSEVLVFSTDNPDWAPPPELKQFAQVFQNIHRQHPEDLLGLDAVRAYFRELYWKKGPTELDAHNLMGLLKRSRHDSLPFETLADEFKVIETTLRPVIVPYDREARDALNALEFAESCVGIARRLQPYLVQVPHLAYQALDKAGAIQPVAESRYGRQFMLLVNAELYNERFGLRWDNPSFMRAESLVI